MDPTACTHGLANKLNDRRDALGGIRRPTGENDAPNGHGITTARAGTAQLPSLPSTVHVYVPYVDMCEGHV